VICLKGSAIPHFKHGGKLALADRLKEEETDRSKIGALLAYLDAEYPDEHDALSCALKDPETSHMKITRALEAEYRETGDAHFRVTVSSVKRYRERLGVSVHGA
jgi:hypothetical protein